MRGASLGNLIQSLRRELRLAESPALGKNTREGHAHALRSAQDRLFAEHNWPFKYIRRDVPMAAGQRYYAPPDNLDLEDIRTVSMLYSGQWASVAKGISTANFNTFNSDIDQRCDPVLRWDFYNDPTDNGDMIEVWPIPATDALVTVRFEGLRKLGALVADTDVAELDDTLLVLTAACDFVSNKDLQKAENKAARHLYNLRRNLADTSTFVSGGGNDPRANRREPPRITITPATTGG